MTWRPVEPLTRTPWTADFAAAKGRAIIFGVLAFLILATPVLQAARMAYLEHNYTQTWGRVGDGYSFNVVSYRVDGQTYTVPYRLAWLRAIHAPLGSVTTSKWHQVFVMVFVDPDNPQNASIPAKWPGFNSGWSLVIGAMFAAGSLCCFVTHRAERRGRRSLRGRAASAGGDGTPSLLDCGSSLQASCKPTAPQ